MSGTRSDDPKLTALAWALGYAQRGWPVLPITPGAKNPIGRLVPKGLKDATTDEATIIEHWRRAPSANVGIVTGSPSGIIVVDIDPKNNGDAWWMWLTADHKPIETATVHTPSGGQHLYFAKPSNLTIPCSIGKIATGVDVRGEKGYVVGAGSRRADSVPYRWESWPQIAELPDWLLARFALLAAAPAQSAARSVATVAPRSLQPIQEGQRNATLTSRAGSMRRAGMSPESIEAALREENSVSCSPPLPADEVRQIAQSIGRYTPPDDGLHSTDAGNAEYFAKVYGDRVRFDHRRRRFLVYQRHRWVPDGDGEVLRLALEAVRMRQSAAIQQRDGEQRKKRIAWALASENQTGLRALLALARDIKPIADTGDQWDQDPFLLGTANGVVDLRTGTLRDGRPEDRITMCVRPAFDPDAKCPLWEKTIAEIHDHDEDQIQYVHRAYGYSLTGDVREECFFVASGTGANGKGTEMHTVGWVLGDYTDDLPFSALELHAHANIPNDVAKLVSKRFVTASESGDVARLNEAKIKALTGRDPITARFMRAEFFTFLPVAKFWLATNNKPTVQDDSEGFWRRVHLIPFTQSFITRENKQLKDALRAEAPGILAWLVRGCLEWQRVGLNPPRAVLAATDDYRRQSDPLAPFYEARCLLDTDQSVGVSDLFSAYQTWSARMAIRPQRQLTMKSFSQQIRRRFRAEERHNRVSVHGIGLCPSGEIEDENSVSLKPSDMVKA